MHFSSHRLTLVHFPGKTASSLFPARLSFSFHLVNGKRHLFNFNLICILRFFIQALALNVLKMVKFGTANMKDVEGKTNAVKLNYLNVMLGKSFTLNERKSKKVMIQKKKEHVNLMLKWLPLLEMSFCQRRICFNILCCCTYHYYSYKTVATKSARIQKWDFHPCSNVSSTELFSVRYIAQRWAGKLLFKSFCTKIFVWEITIRKIHNWKILQEPKEKWEKRERSDKWWHC